MLLTRFLTIFISLSLLPVFTWARPLTWSLDAQLVESKADQIVAHQLRFKKGEKSVLYTPEKPPFGLANHKRVVLSGKTYFLTAWAHGAATLLFRVFAPETSNNKPICEVVSLSEQSDLKVEDGRLKIATILDKSQGTIWVDCSVK